MPRAYCPECGHKLERFTMRPDPAARAAGITTRYHCPRCGQTVDPGAVVRRADRSAGGPDGTDGTVGTAGGTEP